MHHLLTDAQGRPYSALTRLIARAVEAAGLPRHCVAHGLRKAALRRLAEHGSTSKQIAAVSGHKTLREIERYTEKANQGQLADAAIAKLGDEGE
jgi:integrase